MNASTLLFRRAAARVQTNSCQRRWAQVHDVRFFALHPPLSDKIQERYREKLRQKAKEQGVDDVELLKQIYQNEIAKLRKGAVVPGVNAPLSAQEPPTPQSASSSIPFQPPPPPQPLVEPATKTVAKNDGPVKTLASFIDVEKTAELPQKDIEAIWRLRHIRDPQSLCAVMPADTFKRMVQMAKKHPQFILPLPREGQGTEIHFLQWTFPTETTATVLFTHLAEYKMRGEFAQPHTTVTHHLDLLDKKGLVLLEGQVMEGRGISVDEGKFLLLNLQKFYGFEARSAVAKESKEKRGKLMQQFSGGDEAFSVEELLVEAEKVL